MALILALTLALALSVTRRQVRTIGLSNWTRKQLKETLASCRVPPQVLQVELHPLLPQTELRADWRRRHTGRDMGEIWGRCREIAPPRAYGSGYRGDIGEMWGRLRRRGHTGRDIGEIWGEWGRLPPRAYGSRYRGDMGESRGDCAAAGIRARYRGDIGERGDCAARAYGSAPTRTLP